MRGLFGGGAGSGAGESVPVAERFRVMQWLRVAAVLIMLVAAYIAPDVMRAESDKEIRWYAVQATLVFAAVVGTAELLSRVLRDRAVSLFSGMLMLDGIWLASTWYLTGQQGSPVQFLILLHLGAVALLASYRTGLKLAMWHSLLLYAVYNLVQARQLPDLIVKGSGTPGERLGVFVVVLWLVAISTASLSAVNERELRRRRHDLEALTELAESLERTADSASVARTLLDSAIDTFGFPRGVVLAGPEGQLPLLASFGLADEVARRPGRPGPSAVVALAHETHEVQLVAGLDVEHDPWISRLMPDAQNLVVVPLSAEGRPMGALVLEHAGDSIGSGRIARRVVSGLERSASYAALALRNAWLLEQVQRLAATDGLTKIANRRTFESTLEREVARATRSAEHVSLVMLDIDFFKVLNDTHGHQAGDEVLRNVAAALSCECRDFDTPARYGGEEFAVVLPGCGPEEAVIIAERLRLAVGAAPSIVPITSSAGVATYPSHAGDADTLVRAADDALYRSKADGRDRTTVSEGVPPEAQVDALLRRAVSQRLGRPVPPLPTPPLTPPLTPPAPPALPPTAASGPAAVSAPSADQVSSTPSPRPSA